MKVTIIGSGNVGKALGTSLTKAGHDVTLTANDPQHATDAATEIGASSKASKVDAIRDADFVILAARTRPCVTRSRRRSSTPPAATS